MTIDPTADRPVYRQLADLIRGRIGSGTLPAGARIPAEGALAQQHGISRDSVRKAMSVLRGEGLIVTGRDGSHVRAAGELAAVDIAHSERITARMPTDPERRALGIAEGVPVLVVTRPDGSVDIHPADRTVIRYSQEG